MPKHCAETVYYGKTFLPARCCCFPLWFMLANPKHLLLEKVVIANVCVNTVDWI
jgi:hypothetical protein